MENETLDLEQLATILQRDVREVTKMANRGYLPGQKVGGQWRFASAEINYWISTQLPAYNEQELTALEAGANRGRDDRDLLITSLLGEATMAVPLQAGTKVSVLKQLVHLAEQSWNVYDPEILLEAVRQREDMGSTAVGGGVAIPHPHRPNPSILGDSVIAFGRTFQEVPFGGDRGGMCDLFFLICCQDHRTHLRVLARLSRLLLRPGFVEELRSAETVSDAFSAIEAAEREMVVD